MLLHASDPAPMTEQPKPPADTPPASAARGGARPDPFDLWLRGALRELFGPIAGEPVPEALRRLVGGETPAAPAAASRANSASGDLCRRRDGPTS
jgi:hypothetical protein